MGTSAQSLTIDQYRCRQQELASEISAIKDATPNLRDYGFRRQADFEQDLATHQQRVADLWTARETLAEQFNAQDQSS